MSATNQSLSPSTSGNIQLTKPTAVFINSINNLFNNLFFSSDYGLLGFLCILFLVVGLGLVILFEVAIPNMRGQIVNNVIGVSLGIGLLILIFQQMGNNINLFGRKIDLGMIYYLVGLMIVMLLFIN